MADTYRGLTIRLGGDTTQLSSAIKGVTKDANNFQNILRKTSSALKLNPSSLKATELRMEALSGKSTDLYAKLKILETAFEGMRADKSFKEAEMYVAKTGDSIGAATNRFNLFNTQLEKMKRGFAELDGVDTSIQKNYTEWNKSAADNIEKMRQLGTITREDYQEYKRLVSEQQKAQDAIDMTKQVAQMKDLEAEIEKTSAQAKDLAQQYVDLRVKQSAIKGTDTFKETETELSKAKMTALSLEEQLQKVDQALALDPSNIATLSLKMQLLREEANNSQTQLKQVKSRLEELKNVKDIDTNAKNVNEEFTKWKVTLQNNTEELNKAKAAAKALSQEFDKVNSLGKGGDNSQYSKLKSEISKAKNEVEKLAAEQEKIEKSFTTAKAQKEYQELRAEAAKLEANVAKCNKEMGKSGHSLDGWSSSLTSVGLSISTTIQPAMERFLGFASQSAQEIDSAYRDMRKTVNGSEDDFKALRQSALDFSKTHVTSADQILEIQAMGGQLGIAVNDLDKFSQTVSNLNIATNISDAEEMSEKLGQLANITGMTSDEYDKFADSLVRLGNNSPTLESNIMDISSRIGSMASIVGMSVPDILALSTAVASTGQQSEAAGTAISNTMSDIENAVSSGGDSLQMFADVAGTSAEEFANTWNSNPLEAIKQFVQGLKTLEDNGGSADVALEDLGITGVRQKQALLGLTQTLDVLNDSVTMSNDAWNGVSDQWGDAGDAAREAERKSEGFSGQMQILKNNAQVLGDTIAESLAPWLEKANELFQEVTNAVDGMSDSQKQAIVAVAGIVGISGSAMTIIGAMIPVVSKLKKGFTTTVVAAKTLGTGIGALISPLGKLSTGTSKLTTSTSKLPAVLGKAGTAMGKFSSLSLGAKGAILTLAGIIGSQLVSAIQDYVQKQEEFKQSTEGLVNAQKDAKKAADDMQISTASAAKGAEEAKGSYAGLTQAIEDSAKKGADMATEQKDWWTDYYKNSSLLESYIKTIDDLGKKGELSASEIEILKNAVEKYNDITGSSVEIVDEATGKISESTDKLRENANAWRESAKKQAEAKFMNEAIEKSVQDLQNLEDAQKSYNDALDAMAKGDKVAGFDQIKEQVSKTTEAYNDSIISAQNYADELNGTGQSLLSFIGANQEWTNSLTSNGVKIDDFTNYVETLGLTQEQLSAKTPEQISQMVTAYANMSQSSVGFEAAKTAMEGLGIAQEQVAELTPGQVDIIAGEYQRFNDAGMPMDSLRQKISDVGVTQEQLANLTPNDINMIVGAYQNGQADLDAICGAIKNGTISKLGDAGRGGGEAAASGLNGTRGDVQSAAQNVADATDPIEDVQNNTGEWGDHATLNFASGLNTHSDFVTNAANGLANIVKSILGHSVPKEGALHVGGKGEALWGEHLALNFASGIEKRTPDVVSAVEDMTMQARKAMESSEFAADVVYNAGISSKGSAFGGGSTQNTTIYQIGNVTIPQDSKEGETVEDFVKLVLAYKGAM